MERTLYYTGYTLTYVDEKNSIPHNCLDAHIIINIEVLDSLQNTIYNTIIVITMATEIKIIINGVSHIDKMKCPLKPESQGQWLNDICESHNHGYGFIS